MNIEILEILSNVLDLIVLTLLIYFIFKIFVNSEKHLMLINAILALIGLYIFAAIFNLDGTYYVLSTIFSWGIVILVIIFQSEIRESLEHYGAIVSRKKRVFEQDEDFVHELVDGIETMKDKKMGGLITIKGQNSLDDYVKTAVEVDATFSKYLLLTIFNKESPLHDGAIIIEDQRIKYSTTYFPIEIDINIAKELGTRHRAAITISKSTDSITIIISEETGKVSVAKQGRLYQDVSIEYLYEILQVEMKGRKDNE